MTALSGTLTTVSVGNNSAQFLSAGAGGTSPYTYQYYISTVAGFTPGGGNIVGGATSASQVLSSLTPGTFYEVAVIITDSASATVTKRVDIITLTGLVVGDTDQAPVGGVFISAKGNTLNAAGVGIGATPNINSPTALAEAGALSVIPAGPTGYPQAVGPQADYNTTRAVLAQLITSGTITETVSPGSDPYQPGSDANLPGI